MQMHSAVSISDILSFMEERRAARAQDPDELSRREGYLKAAAVLAAIDDIEQLTPVGIEKRHGEAEKLLRGDLVPAPAARLPGSVMLSASARKEALRDLGSHEAMLEALELNPFHRESGLQSQLERYLRRQAKPIEEQTATELDETLQVLVWLGGVLDDLPPIDVVLHRTQYLELLAPFEVLAGDSVFRGRKEEMDKLRRYVGVLPPSSILARIAEKAFGWTKPAQQPALSVSGPGGVGKSALIARFMIEHTRLPQEARIPFAYLDFDRPVLDISDPLTICAEMIRQLVLQFPETDAFRSLGDFLTTLMASSEESEIDQLENAQQVLGNLLGIVEAQLGPRPYMVMLDTFEEVQFRGEGRAYPFWTVLTGLQNQWPFLRVVISGRAPVTSLRLAGQDALQLPIGELDEAAAIAFLESQGVNDPKLAKKLTSMVGGVPLSLKLVSAVVVREHLDGKGVASLHEDADFWEDAADEVVQGYLYDRILGHVRNTQVERLAHPGLVLRRITPDVILHVLKEPCALDVDTLEDAEALFEELKKQTALVSVDDREGALVHRADLRRIMLKLLVDREPAQVRKIHEAAVAWYSGESQNTRRARAEELYHRLQLGQRVDKTDFADPEIRSSINASLVELPVEAQVILASYGFDVEPEIMQRATQEQYEAYQASRIEELIAYGTASLEEATRIMDEVATNLDHVSPLFYSRARVTHQNGDREKALDIIDEGLSYAIRGNNTPRTLELISAKAWALRDTPKANKLTKVLDSLQKYASRQKDKAYSAQHRLQLHELQAKRNDRKAATATLKEVAFLLPQLTSLQLWGLLPLLENAAGPMLRVRPDLPAQLSQIIGDYDGAFRLAVFNDHGPRRALADLCDAATNWTTPGSSQLEFEGPIRRLCAVWPYQVLHTQPPYGRSRSELTEATV